MCVCVCVRVCVCARVCVGVGVGGSVFCGGSGEGWHGKEATTAKTQEGRKDVGGAGMVFQGWAGKL